MRQVLTLAAETLFEVLLGNVARIVNVEVMEGKEQIGLCDSLPAIDSHGKELCVIDLSVVIEVDPLEDFVYLLFTHVELSEGSLDLAHLQRTTVVLVERAERIAKLGEVKGTRVNLIDQESESLDLETLGLAEVLDTFQHHHFVLMQ